MGALLEEQLPGARSYVAGWFLSFNRRSEHGRQDLCDQGKDCSKERRGKGKKSLLKGKQEGGNESLKVGGKERRLGKVGGNIRGREVT